MRKIPGVTFYKKEYLLIVIDMFDVYDTQILQNTLRTGIRPVKIYVTTKTRTN